MEKICLVKLRKKIINPPCAQGEQGIRGHEREGAIPQQFLSSYAKNDMISEAVSDCRGIEQAAPQEYTPSCTSDDIIHEGASDHRERTTAEPGSHFVSPCSSNGIMPPEIPHSVTPASGKKAASGQTVSLTLTQDQIKAIRSSSGLQSVFNRELAGGYAELNYRDDPITIKFECEPLAPVRMLMSDEVVQMLRISNGLLKTIVRDGKLKSYKVGKGRRYMLEDILAYLADNLNRGSQQETLRAETL